MDRKTHFKMYKAGKQWAVSALTATALTMAGSTLFMGTVYADTTVNAPEENSTDVANSKAVPNGSSVTLANGNSASSKTASLGGTNGSNQAATIKPESLNSADSSVQTTAAKPSSSISEANSTQPASAKPDSLGSADGSDQTTATKLGSSTSAVNSAQSAASTSATSHSTTSSIASQASQAAASVATTDSSNAKRATNLNLLADSDTTPATTITAAAAMESDHDTYTEPTNDPTQIWPWTGWPTFQYLNDPNDATKALPYTDPKYIHYPTATGWTGYVYYVTDDESRGPEYATKGFHQMHLWYANDPSKGYAIAPFETPSNLGVDTYYHLYPDPQQAMVVYLDDTTKKMLHYTTLSGGRTSSISNYDQADMLVAYANLGYEVVSNDFTKAFKYGNGTTTQQFNVHLKHKIVVATTTTPGTPGEVIDEKIPNGPKWPDKTGKADLDKLVKQTIHYVYKDGTLALPDKVTSLEFTRTATVDEVTGEITYSNWAGKGSFAAVTSPEIKDFTVDKALVDAVTGITEDSQDVTATVTYSPKPQTTTTPKTPESPNVPTTPQTPVSPQVPVTPQTPASPQVPATPQTPASPQVPATPQTPASPQVPATPQTPVSPQVPAAPQTPVSPQVPAAPQGPVTPQVPATPQTATSPQIPITPQIPSVTVASRTPEPAILSVSDQSVPRHSQETPSLSILAVSSTEKQQSEPVLSRTLPHTGEKANSLSTLVGSILLSIEGISLVGIGYKRFKHETTLRH